ncbi:SDR family NAD(P)-dependent oxidoreductase [Convivina praedatoris]|uniref:Uncharacterized protein n=1 Tax=Convivina praedatoris TaxID=2880963 RepID=A0ABN8H903_9LACO|nr:SDR family oxidoreductase [Convivina sp. LMG 32447]CAH1851705.1 hypothetical protein R077815_00381 [Convivina sp. LMG 32447]CAH1853772.1 hypothetical protein LMG032447_00713 [Convivina sp. LMG 32447]CAH1854295.1 hypothetical protein R078138_00849 [Convivina sp. LMG 32447]
MKNIVITGGTSGVGYAIAKDLVQDNNVIIIGRNHRRGQEAQSRLGHHAHFFAGDLSIENDRQKIKKSIEKLWNKVDVLINSAGVWPKNATDNISINLRSHYAFTMALSQLLKHGRVLIVSGNPMAIHNLPICEQQITTMQRASWLLSHKTLLTILLSEMLAKNDTTVNSFFPGDIQSNLMPYTQRLMQNTVPVGRFLALDQSLAHVTGQFFNDRGQLVTLSSNKYSIQQAEIHLANYLKFHKM